MPAEGTGTVLTHEFPCVEQSTARMHLDCLLLLKCEDFESARSVSLSR